MCDWFIGRNNFYNCFEAGGIFKQIIPFVFLFSFTALYFLAKKLKKDDYKIWHNNLLVLEIASLLLIYLSGNYLAVRELSVNLMNMVLTANENIPLAFVFYSLTVSIPILYLYAGIKNKDIVLLRVSLLLLAFSVFTFKYYYSLGHTEIMLMIAGLILIASTIALMRYLKKLRNGFTSENILSSKWNTLNAEVFVISQTMGGNQAPIQHTTEGGGGSFGGGGSTENF